jgi:hypothetical protein
LRHDEETGHCSGYQINLSDLWTPPEIHTTVELGIQTSAPTALLGLAPERSARASATHHRKSIGASDRDDLGVANNNVTVTDHACPQQSSAHSMRRTKSKNHRLQGALSATS